MSPYRLGKDFNIKKPRFSGITKHGCTQIIFYILTIHMINVGPTKVYLNSHNIRLKRIYTHSTLPIRCFVLTGESQGTPDKVVANCLLSLPFHSFLQHLSYPSCPLKRFSNGTDLASLDETGGSIPFWTAFGLFGFILM